MTFWRDSVQSAAPRVRNQPMRPREWEALLDRDDTSAVSLGENELALAPRFGQLCLFFAFEDEEGGRLHFAELWEAVADDVEEDGWPYVRIDLVEMANRIWIEPLLHTADFRPFGEWMEMERRELSEDAPPPEIPEGYRLRRATEDDFDTIVALEGAAYGEDTRGEAATRLALDAATWVGALEDASDGGRLVGYAINHPPERSVGRIVSAGVDPSVRGRGLGRVLLEAASYQLASQGATRAVLELNPLVGASIRAARDAGFRPGRRGIEWRRPTDTAIRDAIREEERHTGVKARFGEWR